MAGTQCTLLSWPGCGALYRHTAFFPPSASGPAPRPLPGLLVQEVNPKPHLHWGSKALQRLSIPGQGPVSPQGWHPTANLRVRTLVCPLLCRWSCYPLFITHTVATLCLGMGS